MTTLALFWCLTSTALAASPPPSVAAEDHVDVDALLAAAVEAAGLHEPDGMELRFQFRGTPYRLWLQGRRSIYERRIRSDAGVTRTERLEGDTFTATVGDNVLPLSSEQAGALRRSLNSVAYFALMPRPLEDDAVIATSLGATTLGGQSWDTIDIRFREEGGGDDHDDVFRYWFHPETHRLGYLAYTFATGKGGVRVRKVVGAHEVDGVVLLDWVNHGRNGQGLTIDDAVRELEAGTLPELSTIALEDVQVQRGVPAP